LDNDLPLNLYQLINTTGLVSGAIVLVGIVAPYFLIVVLGIAVAFAQLGQFYQKTSLSLKRIDAILRSVLYAHFSESLAGLAVIRGYREEQRFVDNNCLLMSLENRAYYPGVVNQQWLALRLDVLSTCLTFSVSLLYIFSWGISSMAGGLALSYMVAMQANLSWIVRHIAV
jgi:ABC-type multidrug transport system fused ATPase/permease subunit